MARAEPCSPRLESSVILGATMASLQGTLRKAGVDVGYIYRQSHQEWSSDKQLSSGKEER